MKVSENLIIKAVKGAAYCEMSMGNIIFHRFTPEQESYYIKEKPEFSEKLTACAGIVLRFRTDSKSLTLSVDVSKASSRSYFSHDVFVNGNYLDCLTNLPDVLPDSYPSKDYKLGEYNKSFFLGEGEKSVSVYFPALCRSALKALHIDDGSIFIPEIDRGKYLVLGDSISQGYDSIHPFNRYTSRIASSLCLDEHNLAIGGEVFRASFANEIKYSDISLITVAYGSNDWSSRTYEDTFKSATYFLSCVSDTYFNNDIYVISPVWRKDFENTHVFGAFKNTEKMLREICTEHHNLIFVNGFNFLPHDSKYFGDKSLHPNDEGFSYYAEGLLNKININD